MNYKHIVIFVLLFMIIQHLLLVFECDYYLDMVSDIQGYKFNFYKNEKNNFTLKNILINTLIYILVVLFIYYYIIREHKSLLEGYFFTSFLYALWDASLFTLFDKGVHHLPVLLYDTFIVGGLAMGVSQYIIYNYYTILKKHIPLLSVFYVSTMAYCFYKCYKYNPDLSNIKDIVIF